MSEYKKANSCYFLNLGNYTNGRFGNVHFNPPLSDIPPYKEVHYKKPNYNSLTHSKNVVCNYQSINNAYVDNCDNYYSNKCDKI
jgi:hypothetical protein